MESSSMSMMELSCALTVQFGMLPGLSHCQVPGNTCDPIRNLPLAFGPAGSVLAVGTAGAAGAAVTVTAGGAAADTVTGAAAASVTVTGTAASAVTVTAGGAAAVTVTGAGAAVGCGAGVLAEALPSEIPTTAATTMPVIHNHLRLFFFFLGATGGGNVSLRMAMVGAFLLLQELFPAVSARAGSRTR